MVRSNHAFLVTYDEVDDQFYVYDSDDPHGRWPAKVRGQSKQFSIEWRIDDHIGDGPSRQIYFQVRPLKQYLSEIRKIVDSK